MHLTKALTAIGGALLSTGALSQNVTYDGNKFGTVYKVTVVADTQPYALIKTLAGTMRVSDFAQYACNIEGANRCELYASTKSTKNGLFGYILLTQSNTKTSLQSALLRRGYLKKKLELNSSYQSERTSGDCPLSTVLDNGTDRVYLISEDFSIGLPFRLQSQTRTKDILSGYEGDGDITVIHAEKAGQTLSLDEERWNVCAPEQGSESMNTKFSLAMIVERVKR